MSIKNCISSSLSSSKRKLAIFQREEADDAGPAARAHAAVLDGWRVDLQQQQQRSQRQHDNENSEARGNDGCGQSRQNVHHQTVFVRSVPRPVQGDHRGIAQG